MSFYTHTDKKSGDGLAITNWNDLSSAVAGNSGLTLALNSADKIGIGTTAPAVKLQVGNTIAHRSTYNYATANTSTVIHAQSHNGGNTPSATQSVLSLIREGVNAQAYGNMADFRLGRYENSGTNSRTQLDIYLTDGTFSPVSVMSMRSNGNIGIGTASPLQKLHVNGSVQATKFIGDGSGLTNLPVSSTWDQNGSAISYASGNVGIGTSSPSEKLHIAGNLRLKQTGQIQDNASTYNSGLIFENSGTSHSYYMGYGYGGTYQIGYFNGSSGYSNLFAINGSGNVGIGTTSPKQRLHVNGDYYGKGHVYFYANEGDGSSGTAYVQARDTSGTSSIDLQLRTQQNGTIKDVMRLNANGNVSISGGLYVANVPYGDYQNAQWNSSTGQFFQDNSSRRSKRNIKALKDDFYKILQAQPKTYTRPEQPKRWELGYIAEEFEELGLKKLVYYDEEGKPDGVNYIKICMYLLEIIKDHEQKIETLLSGKEQD